MQVFYNGPVRPVDEYDEFSVGYDFKYSLDELIIDDSMLTYNERSVKIVNFVESTPFRFDTKLIAPIFKGELIGRDLPFYIGLQLG